MFIQEILDNWIFYKRKKIYLKTVFNFQFAVHILVKTSIHIDLDVWKRHVLTTSPCSVEFAISVNKITNDNVCLQCFVSCIKLHEIHQGKRGTSYFYIPQTHRNTM